MADAATWADDARNIEKTADGTSSTFRSRFRRSVPEQEAMKWCAPLATAGRDVSSPRSTGLGDPARPEPIRRSAREGPSICDSLPRRYRPASPRQRQSRPRRQLHPHQIFRGRSRRISMPSGITIDRARTADRESDSAASSRKTRSEFRRPMGRLGEAKPDIVAWAWEGHKLAETSRTRISTRASQPPRRRPGSRIRKPAMRSATSGRPAHFIGDEYQAQAMPVIREQLAKAGYRLAGLLNQTFR